MNMIWVSGLPSPETAFLRVFQSGHFWQIVTSEEMMSRSSFLDKMVSSFRFVIFGLIVLISIKVQERECLVGSPFNGIIVETASLLIVFANFNWRFYG